MASAPWDPRGEALNALRTIAADAQYGAEALAGTPMMTDLLKDMLPDAPREAKVLIAAAGAGVAAAVQGYLAQGMDVGTATQLAAGALAERTALTADACAWATSALATALLPPAVPVVSAPAGPGGTSPLPGSDHPTMAPQGAVFYGSGPVTYGPAATLVAGSGRGRPARVRLLAAAFPGARRPAPVPALPVSL